MTPQQEKALQQNEKEFISETINEMKLRSELKLLSIKEKQKRSMLNSSARYKWLGKALKTAGQPENLFEKAHEKDFVRAVKSAKEMHRIAGTNVKTYIKERKETLSWYRENIERFNYNLGNPISSICNWKADRIASVEQTIQADGTFTQSQTPAGQPVSAANNRVIMNLHSVTENSGLQSNYSDTFTTHRFVSTVGKPGLVNATAYYEPIGTYSLVCGGDCFNPGSAIFLISARLKIHVVAADGRVFRTNTPDFQTFFVDALAADCDSESRSSSFNYSTDAHEIVRNRVILCASNDLIIARAQYWVQTWNMQRSVINLNMNSAGFGLNVPLILFQIES